MGRHGAAQGSSVPTARAPSQRRLRVGEELRHILADLLARGELRDPQLQNRPVTVTEVRLSPDLKNATAFVVPLGGEHAAEVLGALRRSAPYARRLLGRVLQLRHIPQIEFELDRSFDHASRIEQLLHRPDIRRDLAAEPSIDLAAPAAPDGPTPRD